MKVFCQEFADGLVRRSIHRWGLDFHLVTAVGEFYHAFAFAPGVHLDIYFHRLGLRQAHFPGKPGES